MLESFPFGPIAEYLEEEDFSLFASDIRQRIAARIPMSGKIHFIGRSSQFPKLSTDPRIGSELAATIEKMQRGGEQVCLLADTILLSFQLYSNRFFVVAVSQVDPLVVEQSTADWLEDTRVGLLRELLVLKTSYKDPETGLLNSSHLFDVLKAPPGREIVTLLVQLPARSNIVGNTFRNSQHAATALITFTDSRFLVHYVGESVFAILVPAEHIGSADQFSSRLVQYLRREGFFRVHIGSSRQGGETVLPAARVLDQAWTALRTAARRGPFSFCDYSFLANADRHPLRAVGPDITKRFQQLSRRVNVFSLIHLNCPKDGDTLVNMLQGLDFSVEAAFLGVHLGGIFYLPAAGETGLRCAEEMIRFLADEQGIDDVYAGVSSFPYNGFSKSEVLANAGKALLHAKFYGPGHAVLFDAVSLNVSGDIYFSDGDLLKAVREYRRGLECGPEDVNLLNSLGVTYALLNKNSLAKSTFERVLAIDADNHMALYNLGIGAELRGELQAGVEHLEHAHRSCIVGDDVEFRREIEMQLGKLYCLAGRYRESLRYLESWWQKAGERQRERMLKYLGEANFGAGKPKKAMRWLQRALQVNAFDHDVLSLLGMAVWQAQEGDEIALSLCTKSVDLAPDNGLLRLRLAKIQQHLEMHEEALANLAQCRGQGIDLTEVQLLRATSLQGLACNAKAKYWARKVQKRCGAGSEPYRQAQVLLDSIQ